MVIMAGNVRPWKISWSSRRNTSSHRDAAGECEGAPGQDQKLESGDDDAPSIGGVAAAYWLDLKGYDPAAFAKKLAMPMLILQGERDYQVTMTDFGLWKAAWAAQGRGVKSYPALNLLFVAGEGKSLPAEYNKPGHVAPQVIADIAAFIKP